MAEISSQIPLNHYSTQLSPQPPLRLSILQEQNRHKEIPAHFFRASTLPVCLFGNTNQSV